MKKETNFIETRNSKREQVLIRKAYRDKINLEKEENKNNYYSDDYSRTMNFKFSDFKRDVNSSLELQKKFDQENISLDQKVLNDSKILGTSLANLELAFKGTRKDNFATYNDNKKELEKSIENLGIMASLQSTNFNEDYLTKGKQIIKGIITDALQKDEHKDKFNITELVNSFEEGYENTLNNLKEAKKLEKKAHSFKQEYLHTFINSTVNPIAGIMTYLFLKKDKKEKLTEKINNDVNNRRFIEDHDLYKMNSNFKKYNKHKYAGSVLTLLAGIGLNFGIQGISFSPLSLYNENEHSIRIDNQSELHVKQKKSAKFLNLTKENERKNISLLTVFGPTYFKTIFDNDKNIYQEAQFNISYELDGDNIVCSYPAQIKNGLVKQGFFKMNDAENYSSILEEGANIQVGNNPSVFVNNKPLENMMLGTTLIDSYEKSKEGYISKCQDILSQQIKKHLELKK